MTEEKLVSFIKDASSKGYTKPEIVKLLLEKSWNNEEIEQAYQEILNPKPKKPAYQPISKPKKKIDPMLIKFIKDALNKHFTKQEIKKALLSKGWSPFDINDALNEVKPNIAEHPSTEVKEKEFFEPKPYKPEFKPKPIKPAQPFKPKPKPLETSSVIPKEHKSRKIIIYILTFIVIAGILSFTFMVFYYMQGITTYTITDPNTGQTITGACLEENCSDMKGAALDFVKTKFMLCILIGSLAALVIIILHEVLPYKNIFLWLVNLAYLIFLTVIAYMWIAFNQTK